MDPGHEPALGRIRGLRACASARGTFGVLALDHRQNLRRELRPDDPTSVTFEEMVAFKRAVVRALGPAATGVLLDPEVGAAQAIVDGSLPPGTGLIVAIEATGYEGPSTARASRILDGWSVAAAKRMGVSAAKLLVYYHPDARNAVDQERLVATVAAECAAHDLALFIEPLSFSIDAAVPRLEGEARRRVVVETARRLTALGGDILKAEFPYDPGVTDEGRWREACAELDEASRAALGPPLGRGRRGDLRGPGPGRLRAPARAASSPGGRSGPRRRRSRPRIGTPSWRRPGGSGWPGWSGWSTSSARRGTPARDRSSRCPSPARAGIAGTPGDLRAPVRPPRRRRAEPGHPHRRPGRPADVRPGRDDRRGDPDGDRQLVGDRRLRGGPARAARRVRRRRRRRRLRAVHARRARPGRHRRRRLPDRPGRPDRGDRDPEPRRGPGQPDRARGDRRAAGERRPARAAGRGAPPPRREHLPPAGADGRACRSCSPRRAPSA